MAELPDMENVVPGWRTGKYEVPEWSFDGRPALIINHMQEGIVGHGEVGGGRINGGPVDQTQEYLRSHPHLIANQKKLLAAFRAKKLPIFFVSVIPNPIGFTPKWGFIFQMVNARSPIGWLDNAELQELVKVIPEMGRRPEERMVYHTGTCLFTGSHLEEMLRRERVLDLVITGFTAQSTLYNSVVQASDKYYSVVIPRDSTGSPDGRDSGCDTFVFERMMPMYSLVTTTDDVIKHLP